MRNAFIAETHSEPSEKENTNHTEIPKSGALNLPLNVDKPAVGTYIQATSCRPKSMSVLLMCATLAELPTARFNDREVGAKLIAINSQPD